MIQMPKRSVTRFFIPLIDVLTLLFCIFLLMPMVKATGEAKEAGQNSAVSADERAELEQLRQEKKAWLEWQELQKELDRLRQERRAVFEQDLALRVLEIGEEGRLFFYDPSRLKDRRVEITQDNVRDMIETQQRLARGKELYFLILYPRRANGFPGYPLAEQRQEYDRWFQNVAHSYDIPYRSP
jgi:hypothetical protein